jgi:decaprenylphospho-beta-D-erythro-pentofuranosid-2-ulose 2-reductase
MKDPRTIVVVGANSAIARGVAALYADQEATFFLVARDEEKLRATVAGLQERGGTVTSVYVTDLRLREGHADIVEKACAELGTIDLVLIAHGSMPEQSTLDEDVDAAMDTFITNALSPISLAHRFFNVLEAQGSGSLVTLSSVAGDRGRRSNYTYGAAKAALTAYTSGLRGRGRSSRVHVLTVKPGPVRTPLTATRKVPLMVSVAPVARDIVRAIDRRQHVVYTPGIWRPIMFFYRLVPEWIASRLRF